MPVLGMRSTESFVSNERPEQWRKGVFDEFADAAKIVNLMYRVGKQKTSDIRYHWWEKRYPTREITVGAGDVPDQQAAGAADTMDTGANEAYNCKVGSMLLNTRTLERAHVTAVTDANTLAIIRGVGGSGNMATWLVTDKIQVIGSAYMQGADVPTAISWDPVEKYNFTQIHRDSTNGSGTALATELRTGALKQRTKKETLRDHMVGIAWNTYFGIRALSTSGGVTSYCGGLFDAGADKGGLSTHVKDFYTDHGGVTKALWREFLYNVFQYGSDEKILFAGADAIQTLEEMADAFTTQMADVPKQDSYGMTMTKWKLTPGTLFIAEEKLFSRSTALSNWGVIVDPANLVRVTMPGRDTDFLDKRGNPGYDGEIGEFLTECGLEVHDEYTMGIIKGFGPFLG